ncbi:MAG: hypothetical protein QXT45_05465 [Candidatus Bilamarchaeaceae archaeon]
MSAAGIRFLGVDDANIPIPPTGRAFLFYNDVLNVFRARLDDGSYVTLNVSQEYVEDIVGNLINSSSTIVANYDDPANQLYLEIANNSIQTIHVNQISPIKIGDAYNVHVQNTLITSDNALTQIITYNTTADATFTISAKWTALRLSGASGSPGDGASFIRHCRVRRWSSALTLLDVQSTYTSRDGSFNILIGVSGTQIIFYVIGKMNQNIRWVCDVDIHISPV